MTAADAEMDEAEISGIVRAALAVGVMTEHDRSVIFHDLSMMRARFVELEQAFPSGTLHAAAIKANPLVSVLSHLSDVGAGLEAASIEEVHLALAAGCPPERIVFDSPAKTFDELATALELGLLVNANSYVELERIESILDQSATGALIGLRINPEVGAGLINATSVGDSGSKFGVRSSDPEAIVSAFQRHPWLRGLHVHVGSQGCELPMLVAAAERIRDLIEVIRQRVGGDRLSFVDLGGGLPVAYLAGDQPPTLQDYVGALRQATPELFDGSMRLVTEFGRWLHAGCGAAVTRVEYTSGSEGERQRAIVHLGADFLVRPVYQPTDWAHRYLALRPNGAVHHAPPIDVEIAGPLCFAGDIIEHRARLPHLEPGDLIVIRDVGAYTLSMWSRHCSRGIPRVVGHRDGTFTTLREPEQPRDIVDFWS